MIRVKEIKKDIGIAKKFLPNVKRYEGDITFLNTPNGYIPATLVFTKGTKSFIFPCWRLTMISPDVPKIIQQHF